MMNRHVPQSVRSMRDLLIRKQILQNQIEQKEQDINQDYRGLIDTLSFRNLLGSVSRDVAASNLVIGKAFAIGKLLIDRRKKRRQLKKTTGTK